MATKEKYKAAVRTIIEFVLREGDILPGTPVISRFTEGIRGHKAVQENRRETYRAEVPVTTVVEGKHSILEIGGRADGIEEIEGEIYIEEIKTTDINLESIQENDFPLHWAQAMLYGYIYAHQQDLSSVIIRLTYFHLQTDTTVSLLVTVLKKTRLAPPCWVSADLSTSLLHRK